MATRFTEEIDGEGVAWAAAGFVASLLIGVVVEPFPRHRRPCERRPELPAGGGGRRRDRWPGGRAHLGALGRPVLRLLPDHALPLPANRLGRPGDHGRPAV